MLTLALTLTLASAPSLAAQGGGGNPDSPQRRAQNLDREGKGEEARVIWQQVIDAAPDPAARAAAHRRMAMSWGFEGNCTNAVKHHELVIAYWVTREKDEPQNAHYQQGEMANESARVCIDAGDLATAERMYLRGAELGNREPAPRTHPKSLWDFRTAHARARLAALRGDQAEAAKQLTLARQILDSDTAMAGPQERFYPYLAGFVALYAGDLATAEAELTRALAMPGNGNDPAQIYYLALTWEKQGRTADARAQYQKAFDAATSHNPPAAFGRREARKKLAGS